MPQFLNISVHYLQPLCHARGESGEPEWPPSPLRLFQSLVAASAARWNERIRIEHAAPALSWLEKLPAPSIVAPPGETAKARYRLYVPNNVGDLVAGSWSRGGESDIAKYRTEKDVQPTWLPTAPDESPTVHYLFEIPDGDPEARASIDILIGAARSLTHVGWGVDMVAGNATVIDAQSAAALKGVRWQSTDDPSSVALRVPRDGTFQALTSLHERFLNRIQRDSRGEESFHPVPPLSEWKSVGYRRETDVIGRPWRLFELRNSDGTFFSYSQTRLIHVAAMTRHLACDLVQRSLPRGTTPGWSEQYVAGHNTGNGNEHRQLSYLPLPSIGITHADQAVRRVLIAGPIGDLAYVDHIAKLLAGQRLVPEAGTTLQGDPLLIPKSRDAVTGLYVGRSSTWTSVTPVILPGHDDHRPAKTRKLIEKALAQSGVSQTCEFEWSPYSAFARSLTAHRYNRRKEPAGYVRPEHLKNLTAVHLTLRFSEGVRVPGPLVIGAGRHCGLGLMAIE